MSLNAEVELKIKACREHYLQTLPDKIIAIRSAWCRLEDNGRDMKALDDLLNLTHKMAGAGGMFGLESLSCVASQLENTLMSLSSKKDLGPSEKIQLQQLVNELELISRQSPSS